MLQPVLKKNDSLASWLIGVFSVVVFLIVVALGKFKLTLSLGFDVHLFAALDAAINSVVAVVLIAALIAIQRQKFQLHKQLMLLALVLSILFLVSYVLHRLLSGEAHFGDSNHDGVLSDAEKLAVGYVRFFYYFILTTHIILAAIILPFILFASYRALIGEFAAHKKLARITWPLWFYVAITGPIVYFMIAPYYI